MSIFSTIIEIAFFSAAIYIMVSLGAIFCERSGIVNVALDGQMIFGAFAYSIVCKLLFVHMGQSAQILGWIFAMILGMTISLAHAYVSINIRGNQIISGIAINIFAAALTMLIVKSIFKIDNIQDPTTVYKMATIPVPIILTILIIVIAGFFIAKTKIGKRMIATGENPNAVAAQGISVYKMRYLGTLVSGALAGLGGAFFIQSLGGGRFSGTVNGLGFISLAILIVGQWRIKGIFLGSLLFGFISSIANNSPIIPGLKQIPAEFWTMVPYLITLIIMVFTAKNTHVPKASGIPYDVSAR